MRRITKGLSPTQVYELCIKMRSDAIDTRGFLEVKNICYWHMGRVAFASLDMLDCGLDRKNNTFLGMDIRMDYSNHYALEIKEKIQPQIVVNIDATAIVNAANTIKKGFENMFGTLRNIEIVKVIFNEPATIVIWSDGTKTVVKTQNGETFDREKGLAMAICKKAFGNKGNYNEVFKKWVPED